MLHVLKIPLSVLHLDTVVAIMIINFPHIDEFVIVRENVKWVDVYTLDKSDGNEKNDNENFVNEPTNETVSPVLKSCDVIDSIDLDGFGPELSVYLTRSIFDNQDLITLKDIEKLLKMGPETKTRLLQIAQPINNSDYFLLNVLPHIFQETQQEVLNKHTGRLGGQIKSSINSSGNDRKYTTLAYTKPLNFENNSKYLDELIVSRTDLNEER
ncbi:unnamed protein product [Ceutorhynchus assimilis]|uniref:Uncharacterized protein n=1 Tax=Ceutorhynchus assimilis TaxID=467358 RepID=A0A9N9N1F6_9CUCU|nr:unnamed protein product [Ceutorhynchus assimilis]